MADGIRQQEYIAELRRNVLIPGSCSSREQVARLVCRAQNLVIGRAFDL